MMGQTLVEMVPHVKAVKLARDVALIFCDARNIMLNVDKLEELQSGGQNSKPCAL